MINQPISIQNKTVATIQTCAEEPIHIPGSIQPHGFVLVVNEENCIVLCSANTGEFLGKQNSELLNQRCEAVLPEELYNAIGSYVKEEKKDRTLPMPVQWPLQSFDCFFHNAGSLFIVECVQSAEPDHNLFNVMLASHEIIRLITPQTGLQQVCQLVAQQIQHVTGYSRVMIYRFDDQYNGQVYAEALCDGQDSFLGLHYPHTDIPPQARALYLRNLIRTVPDVQYAPVPVVTLRPEWGRPEAVDLSSVHLRSVSPIHIQYLKNMGVAATLTISLVQGNKLWGLVACHHHQPKHLSFTRQSNALMLAQILSAQLAAQESAETYQLVAQLEAPLQELLATLNGGGFFSEERFADSSALLHAVGASGAVLYLGDRNWSNGLVPRGESLDLLKSFLADKSAGWHTHHLSAFLPNEPDFSANAAGLLSFHLPTSPQPSLLVFFRQAKSRTVQWAGQPQKKDGSAVLTPRSSFSAWQELIEGESEQWQQPAINAGIRVMHALQDNLLRTHLQEEELRMRRLNEQLVKANKELENIHWISTHDLKEPLRKIQMFASMINKGEGELSVQQVQTSIERIKSASSRMQRLIDDLMLYGKMSSPDSATAPVPLAEIVLDVKKSFEEELAEGTLVLDVQALPLVQGNAFQLQQLFINLIVNSVKFRQPGRPARVSVAASAEDHFHRISICDDGLGFPAGMSEKIFQLFQRGHNMNVAQGTGVGLSICKKIMENHNGTIEAESEVGKGACFHLMFPSGA